MAKFKLSVIESRVYPVAELDVPVVSVCQVPIATAPTFEALLAQFTTWARTMDLAAVDWRPEEGQITVEKTGLVLECLIETESGELTSKQIRLLEQMLND